MADSYSTDQNLGFLLQRAHSILRGRLTALLSKFDLHLGHFSVLSVLYERAGLSQSQLIEILAIDKSAMVHIVDHLERREFVARQPNPSDRRAYSVELTEVGRQRFEVLGKLVADEQNSYFAPLGPNVESFRTNLQQLIALT